MARSAILSGSVGSGRRALNRPSDVRDVQHLLNLTAGDGMLPEDGLCTPALIARIVRSQRTELRYSRPDGRVDPGGRMRKVLLARAAEKGRARPAPKPMTPADESWAQWATTNLAALRDAMAGAVGPMFGDRARR